MRLSAKPPLMASRTLAMSAPPLAASKGLGHGANGDADNHLVGQFGELARAVGANVCCAPQYRENALCTLKVCGLAAHHDGQGVYLRAHGAARDGGVQVRDAYFAQARGMVAGLARLDGGHIDEQAALAQGGGGGTAEKAHRPPRSRFPGLMVMSAWRTALVGRSCTVAPEGGQWLGLARVRFHT